MQRQQPPLLQKAICDTSLLATDLVDLILNSVMVVALGLGVLNPRLHQGSMLLHPCGGLGLPLEATSHVHDVADRGALTDCCLGTAAWG